MRKGFVGTMNNGAEINSVIYHKVNLTLKLDVKKQQNISVCVHDIIANIVMKTELLIRE